MLKNFIDFHNFFSAPPEPHAVSAPCHVPTHPCLPLPLLHRLSHRDLYDVIRPLGQDPASPFAPHVNIPPFQ